MIITSPLFKNGEKIPLKFSCDGDPPTGGINPELQIQNVPEGAKSLALIVDDPDATRGNTFTHWLLWNIDSDTTVIKEESVPPGLPSEALAKEGAVEGVNDFGNIGYGGPCPPKGANPHRYYFKLYALDAILKLSVSVNKNELEAEINKHLIANAELVGYYGRQ